MKRTILFTLLLPCLITGQDTMNSANPVIRKVETQDAPQPVGPYSQAVSVSTPRILFISGQIPIDKQTGILTTDIAQATALIMNHLRGILHKENMDFKNVVKTTIYLTSIHDFATVNKVYESFLGNNICYPARETVAVAALPKGANVEISMIAAQ